MKKKSMSLNHLKKCSKLLASAEAVLSSTATNHFYFI